MNIHTVSSQKPETDGVATKNSATG